MIASPGPAQPDIEAGPAQPDIEAGQAEPHAEAAAPVPRVDLPSHSDPVIAGLSEVIGGPVGDRARMRQRWLWTPMRILLALAALVVAFNWVQKSPCRDGRWENNEQYTSVCYTDVLALYFAEHLNEGKTPYLEYPVEYPVLTGFMMGAIGLPVHALGQSEWVNNSLLPGLETIGLADGGPLNEGKLFYDVTTLAFGLFAMLTVWAIVRTRRRRPWDAAMVALAPATFVTATVNWDLFAICLCTLAIYAWARRAPAWAGMLFGLAIAAKLYPLFILGPLFLLCLRRKRLPEFGLTIWLTGATWIAVNLPIYVANPKAWLRFYEFSEDRGVDWGTFWYIGDHFQLGSYKPEFQFFGKVAQDTDLLNNVSQLLLAACCVGIMALVFVAKRPPRLGQVAFLVVAAFLLTNKVWSQQFVLWLIPLAVLARPRWSAFLAWQVCELGYFFAFYQILLRSAPKGKSLMPEVIFTYAAMARWVSVAVLCGLVVREILVPELDVVRADGDDDPEGGVLLDPHPAPAQEDEYADELVGASPG